MRARVHACLQKLADSTGRARELCDHVLQITELLMQVLDGEESVAEVSRLSFPLPLLSLSLCLSSLFPFASPLSFPLPLPLSPFIPQDRFSRYLHPSIHPSVLICEMATCFFYQVQAVLHSLQDMGNSQSQNRIDLSELQAWSALLEPGNLSTAMLYECQYAGE